MSMTFTRLCTLAVIVGLALVAGQAVAQERTASGNLSNQVTWAGLSNKLNITLGKSDILNVRMDQAILCGKKNKLYAPGAAEADSDGCVFSALSASDTNTINNMTMCALQGAVYSATSNSCIYPGKNRWYYEASHAGTNANRKQIAPPAGYPTCTGNGGQVGRLCETATKACLVTNSQRIDIPRTCYSRGGDSSDYCTGGGSYTNYTYDTYRCE